MTVRLICLGMSAQDAIYRVPAIPATPVKVLATHYRECGGGMAANASVAAARLGAHVQYWGRVGDDVLGQRITGELKDEGVDTTQVRRVPGCVSPSAAILVDAQGERLICAYNDPSLDRDPSWLPLAKVAHVNAVLADVRWVEGASAVLDEARAAGKIAMLDADIGPVEALSNLFPRATHVVFSAGGLGVLCGGAAPGDALLQVASMARGLVGVTLGADGLLWREAGAEHHVKGIAVAAIDTLAAGDVWHAAFTIALAEGQATRVAAHFANVAAAIKCEREGGRSGAPTRAEVDVRLTLLN